jgi:two-component system cell cycle sensor histidine kinase/response regulator CckA
MKRVLKDFLRKITAPSVPVDDPIRMRSMKLLSLLILSFIGGAFLYSLLQIAVEPDFTPTFLLINGSNTILAAAFFFNRRGRFRCARVLALICISAAILFATMMGPPEIYIRYLFGMSLPVIMGSILLSKKGTIILALSDLAGIFLIQIITPGLTFGAVIAPLGIYITMSLLILVGVRHRDDLEKERQNELAHKEERYRSMIENIGEVIFSLDMEGHFTYISPVVERITLYKSEEIIGRSFSDFVHPDDLTELQQSRERLLAGIEETSEFRLIDKDGKTLHIRTTSHVVGEKGVSGFITGIATDITVQRKLEAQFHQAQKMESVGRLAGGVAHDFNNLITVIMGYCRMLTMDENLPGDAASLVMNIKTAAERGAALTRQLLTFSRAQDVQPVVMIINKRLANFESMLQRLIRENIIFTVSYAPKVRSIKIDPAQLAQVMMNLTVNAVDAMPDGGLLKIETANVFLGEDYCRQYKDLKPGDYVAVSVSDTGCGMDNQTKEYIFDPFFTTKETGKGTGLGLSTVYGIVTQNSGHIWFDSHPGIGSTFKIYFPAVDESEAEEIKMGECTDPAAEKKGKLLLVVEDEDDLREMMVKLLRGFGYRVYAAEDGEKALRLCERLEDETVDMLITDVVMPGITGKSLAVKLFEKFPGMGVLYISGYTDKDIVISEIVDEGLTFLAKPFSPQALTLKIREILKEG